ncbi:hypothetical protein Patl1_10168 [Pistacia atlantica]|uniref:Uncharacterized protein n=1 Tax=Pistacia atlantica TaxID=434234 RepID=A0ACC1A877_9ROSI|nr:hypothetical protein Patl1_10168 [Pistacia atlantica]
MTWHHINKMPSNFPPNYKKKLKISFPPNSNPLNLISLLKQNQNVKLSSFPKLEISLKVALQSIFHHCHAQLLFLDKFSLPKSN